jgi:hypothetical protein
MRSPLTVFMHLLAAPDRSSGRPRPAKDGRRDSWRVWRRPRTLAVAAVGASLLGWGSASALSGPEPVPDSYGGRFVLTYAGQATEVVNVSGCDLAPAGGTNAVVKPCRFEVPANAASALKQKIVTAIDASVPPSYDQYVLTHYTVDPATGQTTADYAAAGRFRITEVTLPILDRLDSQSDMENLGVELTPLSGADAPAVQPSAASFPPLKGRQAFQVGTRVPGCGDPVSPPAVQIAGFTTTTPRSLSVSIDSSGFPAVKLGSVRLPAGDSTAVNTARGWLAKGTARLLTVSMASYDCQTHTSANAFTMSLPVRAASMDPFPRTDGRFTVGLAAALAPGTAPTIDWK